MTAHSSPIAVLQTLSREMNAMYCQYRSATFVFADNVEVSQAIDRFLSEYEEMAAAVQARRDCEAMAHMWEASRLALFLENNSAQIRLVRGA